MSGQKSGQSWKKMVYWRRERLSKKDGLVFTLSKFPGEFAFVIEYADSIEDALRYRLEDGDRFYLDDIDEETMFENMLQEVELAVSDEGG